MRAVRTELTYAYRELEWQDLRAAVAALIAMANIDQGLGADARLNEIEARLAAARPNGHDREARIR